MSGSKHAALVCNLHPSETLQYIHQTHQLTRCTQDSRKSSSYELYVRSIDVYVTHLLWSARVAQSPQQ